MSETPELDLRGLDPVEERVVRSVYAAGATITQTAEALSMTPSAVSAALMRAYRIISRRVEGVAAL